MFPVATPALQNCTFSVASLTPPQTIEEGVSTIERVLAKDLLCMHDVEVLNHTYLALDRLEKQQGKIPERNSSTALKMIADKVDAIKKCDFGSRGLISLYYLQRFSEEKLQLVKRFENFRTSMSINPREVAKHLCNCGTEEQFDSDAKALFGNDKYLAVLGILWQKKEKFRQMTEKERKVEAIRGKWRQNGSSCICPLTLGLITDPVLDEHGHCFEKRALATRLKAQPLCPINDKPITEEQLIFNDDLKKQIESYRTQGFSMTLRERKDVPQPQRNISYNNTASHLLSKAQELEQQQKFREAEHLYSDMLKYTSRSADYANLPALFEKKGEKERATAAYVVLADLQKAEGKQEAEIATLQKLLTLANNSTINERLAIILHQKGQKEIAAQLYLELARQALYNKNKNQAERCCGEVLKMVPGRAEAWKLKAAIKSDQAVETLLRGAGEVSMPLKERIGLCKMVMVKDPTQLLARILFLELDRMKAKNKASQLKQRVKMLELASKVFGKAQWEKYFGNIGVEPLLPKDIHQILFAPCPFWPGKRIHETHLLVLVPQTVNGQPLTLKALGDLVKTPLKGNATKYRYFELGKHIDSPAPLSHWVLLTRDVFKDSLNKNYQEQQVLLAQCSQKAQAVYEVPTVLDATVCLFMEYFRSGTRLCGDKPYTWAVCEEEFDANSQLGVGGFTTEGLSVRYYEHNTNSGVWGCRKL